MLELHGGGRTSRLGWAVPVACLCGAVASSLHVLQLAASMPSSTRWGWAAEWPHSFHLWVLEALAWMGVGLALLARSRAAAWRLWWMRQSPLGKALAVVGSLMSVELFLAVGFWLTWPYGVEQLGWLRAFFFLGDEHRPASLFSATQLWFAGWLAWRCYQHETHKAWLLGLVVCVYLGLDEWFAIHEFIGVAARQVDGLAMARAVVQTHGLTVYLWQVLFLPVVLVIGVLLFQAFRRITSVAELVWLVAGVAVFLGGALGFESVEANGVNADLAWWTSSRAHANLLAEELMEMLGVTIVVGVFARRCFGVAAEGPNRAMAPPGKSDPVVTRTLLTSLPASPPAS